MNSSAVVWFVATLFAETYLEQNPPVLAKWRRGQIYVTRREPVRPNQKAPPSFKKNAIIGIDFRPTAGTEPKKVAEVVRGTYRRSRTCSLFGSLARR